jgi:poly-beta-1,6-N-acetyl-D-glucosamine biosynthesis protein PgaD
MRAERPIISHPERQSPIQHFASVTITIVAWSLWGYLWLPALSVVTAVFGLPITYIYVARSSDEISLLLIFVIMLVCNIAVSSWSSYNYIRFARNSRRRSRDTITHEEVGSHFGIKDPATLSLLLQERRLNLHFDRAGALVHAEPLGEMNGENSKA